MPKNPYRLHDSLGYLVHRATHALSARLTRNFAAAGYDVTCEQWKVLVFLWEEDGQPQTQLAAHVHKNKASLTRLLDGLERRGLVAREPGSSDRRRKRVFLTPAGLSLRAPLTGLASQTLAEAQAGVAPAQMLACKNTLRAVLDNLAE